VTRQLTAAFLAAVVALGATILSAQQPQEPSAVFRAQVDATEVDVLVTDSRGNLVTDLTAGDFELFEDGRPQKIVSFTLVDIPIERVERSLASPDVEPDIGTNEYGEGRVYIIAIDDILEVQALRTRRFLRRFIEQEFAPNDVAAIVYMGRGQSRNTQDFTGNRRLLLEAADKVKGGFPYEAAPSTAERSSLVRNRMKALRNLVEFAATLKGRRKALILLTAGLGVDVFEALDYTGGTKSIAFGDLHAAITAATRGNVAIYPIDPAGLTIGGDNLGVSEFVAFSGVEATIDLRALAEATGGFAVVNTNSIQESFARIVRDNSRYYVLGFSSTNDRRDGRFRRLEVRVKRPGLTVQARRGYLAPLGGRSQSAPLTAAEKQRLAPAIAEALGSPVPSADVPMRVFAASYQRGDRRAKVAIALEMNASALGFVEKDGKVVGDVAVALAAVSADGKITPGPRHEARVSFNKDATDRATAGGVRVLTEMQLPPGRYQLRAAGGTPARAGSVMYDLDVPDYTGTGLTMSGVALTADSARSGITIRPFDPLREELPGPITATREFQAGDRLSVYAEVYEKLQNAAEHVIEMKVELRTDAGRVIATTREERSSKELAGSGGHGFLALVPLEDAAPGLYVIHVEASANVGSRPTASRDILIRVL
jgi:VWFA-related protein